MPWTKAPLTVPNLLARSKVQCSDLMWAEIYAFFSHDWH
jgi:hypothetical protein